MSLRDDLDLILSEAEPSRYSHQAVTKFQDAVLRLRAALTPAAEKWLEALPGILDAKAKRVHEANHGSFESWQDANDELRDLLEDAVDCSEALHNATEQKEQK